MNRTKQEKKQNSAHEKFDKKSDEVREQSGDYDKPATKRL